MNGVTWRGAAIVAVVALVAGACADDGSDPVSAPSTTGGGPTTTGPASSTTTTEAATTTTTSTSSTTTTTTTTTTTSATETTEPRDVPYWTVECIEQLGESTRTYAHDPALTTFIDLGVAPSLDLVMPEVVTSAGPYGSIAGAAPIPGGIVVGVYPPDGWPIGDEPLTSSSLVAVDHDGTIRWRRCFDELETRHVAVAPPELDPDTAWVISTRSSGQLSIVGVDLATGADVDFPTDVTGLAERGAGGRRFVVLGPPHGDGPIPAGDRLLVVDTLDATTSEIPVPPSWVGVEGAWVQVVDDDPSDDEYALADDFPIAGETAAVYVDGAWSDDPAVQRELLPMQVTETFGEPYELRLHDGAGDLIWSVPDFHGVSREGFRWAVADDVVLAMRCIRWDGDGSCPWVEDEPPQEELVAFDVATGRELWTLEGSRAVPVLAGDRAIVTEWDDATSSASGYVLLDLLTGEPAGANGDPWPAGSFAEECCGGDVYVNVRRFGGVVVATNMEHVRIWYPSALTTSTVTIDLMS